MAARVDPAARHSLTNSILYVLLCIFCALSSLSQTISAQTVYDRTKLLSNKESCQDYVFGNYDYIPTGDLTSPSACWSQHHSDGKTTQTAEGKETEAGKESRSMA